MKTLLLAAMAWLALSWATANAADLTKIDRSIAKEPIYQAKPKYCLLVFGPEAKTRVWLVVDGDVLYVDRNANGDLTEAGEALAKVKVGEAMGEVAYHFQTGTIPAAGGPKPPKLIVSFTSLQKGYHIVIDGIYRQGHEGYVQFAEQKEKAPIFHFYGPLSIALAKESKLDRAGGLLCVRLGTPGLGEETFAKVSVVTVPEGVHPLAEIEFPNKKKTGPPVKLKVSLTTRAC